MPTIQIFVLQSIGGRTGRGDVGGGTQATLSLAECWAKSAADVHLITNAFDSGADEQGGIPDVRVLPSAGFFGRFGAAGSVLETFLNPLLQRRAADAFIGAARLVGTKGLLICATHSLSDVIQAVWLSRRWALGAVVYFHHISAPPWWFPRRRGGVVRTTLNWILSLVALSITKLTGMLPSVDNARIMKESGWRFDTGVLPDPGWIGLSHPATPVEHVRPISACFISRVAKSKGVFDLIRLWNRLQDVCPGAILHIGGTVPSPADARKLQREIRRYRLESVVIVRGYLSQEEKVDLLSSSRLFVFPSYEEGWSLSAMEACAYGAIPVLYDLPAYDYLGEAAVKVTVGDWRGMTDAVAKLLHDPPSLKPRSESLQRIVRQYTCDTVANQELEQMRQFLRSGTLHASSESIPGNSE